MKIAPATLAQDLAMRLRPYLPAGVSLEVAESDLVLHSESSSERRSTSYVGALMSRHDIPIEEALRLAVVDALNTVQDYVCEVTAKPWPTAMTDTTGAGASSFPVVERKGNYIEMSFRAGPGLVLELPRLDVNAYLEEDTS